MKERALVVAARRTAYLFALTAASVAVATTVAGAIQRGGAVSGMSLVAKAGVVSTLLTGLGMLLLICLAPRRRRHSDRAPRAVEIAQHEARTDNLTGLGNHRSFHHDLSIEIQRRTTSGTHFTLMAIDLDGLKQINDTNGHQAGDLYIRRVSDAVREALEDEGTVYRTGGDEFMVLLPGRRNWHGLTLAQKINEATRAAVGRRAISIGLAESTGTESRQAIIHQADLALYEAKRTKLSALTYHAGLAPAANVTAEGPSHHQKTLAAALARAVDAKDVGTRSHSETVAELCVGIGQRLGLGGEGLERLRLAGLLHDVGKIGVPDAILQKSAALAADERDEMKQHVLVGHSILISAEMEVEAEWVLHHHERCDGAGYPAGLHADAIPLQSKIIAVADAFEAMTGARPYRVSITTAEALDELRKNVDSQFDKSAVLALVDVVDHAASEPDLDRLPSRTAERVTAQAVAA
jgi:diguanylate cyclase (GGDEF)-like protein